MLTVQEIRERLDQRFDLVTQGTTSVIPRHRTLRATMDWSYDLLADSERLLWKRVAIFVGGFSAAAAEAVCADESLPHDRVLIVLKSLLAQSLLSVEFTRGETRYRLLESTRSYILEGDRFALGRDEDAERHARWIASLASRLSETCWTEPIQKVGQRLQADLGNIRAAIEWSLRPSGDARLAARIVCGLREFWFAAGLHDECQRWVRSILPVVEEQRDPDIAAALWLTLARVSSAMTRVSAAKRSAERLEALGDTRGVALSLDCQTWGLTQIGQLDEALRSSEKALDLYRDLGMQTTWAFAQALCSRGDALRLHHRLPEARGFYNQSLVVFRLLRDDVGPLMTMISIAEWELTAGDTRAAIDVATQALAIAEQQRAVGEASVLLANRAAYHLIAANRMEARSDAVASITLAGSIGLGYVLTFAIGHVAAIYAGGPDSASSALLCGYVDAWYRREAGQKWLTERLSHDILLAALRESIPDDELRQLLSIGAELTQRAALSEVERLTRCDVPS
jgi:non-specific serine/threonine protein kinase